MSLSLKVSIIGAGSNDGVRTMRFTPNMSVSECCKQIAEKAGLESTLDRGLFQAAVDGKTNARWLKMNRTLQYYDLNSNVSFKTAL